jgi:hypothetical protein
MATMTIQDYLHKARAAVPISTTIEERGRPTSAQPNPTAPPAQMQGREKSELSEKIVAVQLGQRWRVRDADLLDIRPGTVIEITGIATDSQGTSVGCRLPNSPAGRCVVSLPTLYSRCDRIS